MRWAYKHANVLHLFGGSNTLNHPGVQLVHPTTIVSMLRQVAGLAVNENLLNSLDGHLAHCNEHHVNSLYSNQPNSAANENPWLFTCTFIYLAQLSEVLKRIRCFTSLAALPTDSCSCSVTKWSIVQQMEASVLLLLLFLIFHTWLTFFRPEMMHS